jgi:hypothetical protein
MAASNLPVVDVENALDGVEALEHADLPSDLQRRSVHFLVIK